MIEVMIVPAWAKTLLRHARFAEEHGLTPRLDSPGMQHARDMLRSQHDFPALVVDFAKGVLSEAAAFRCRPADTMGLVNKGLDNDL
jgi:hypothetical protein